MADSEPVRIAGFARFFKQYMNVSSVVAASIPIPVTSLHVIPTFSAQTGYLSAYTSLFCFLLLAFAFYLRHAVAGWMFPGRKKMRWLLAVLPGILIVGSLLLIFAYHYTVQLSVQDLVQAGAEGTTAEILKSADPADIPRPLTLSVCYVGLFLCVEAAFILMALREYLQELLGLSDLDLIHGVSGAERRAGIESQLRRAAAGQEVP